MPTPTEVENLRPVFKNIMKANQLKPENVKRDRACVHISDKGNFECKEVCSYKWESNFSWITFDLKEMEISYRWKMKCKNCLTAYIPKFDMEQLEAMYERAVRWYKGDREPVNVNIGHAARRNRRPPHIPELCEKCQWGQSMCWLGRFC